MRSLKDVRWEQQPLHLRAMPQRLATEFASRTRNRGATLPMARLGVLPCAADRRSYSRQTFAAQIAFGVIQES